jgi:hypothetical protein
MKPKPDCVDERAEGNAFCRRHDLATVEISCPHCFARVDLLEVLRGQLVLRSEHFHRLHFLPTPPEK